MKAIELRKREGSYSVEGLIEEYAKAIDEHLAGSADAASLRAKEAGRSAYAAGFTLGELMAAYREAVNAAEPQHGLLSAASECLAQSLAPYDEIVSAATESHARMQQSLDTQTFIEAELRHQNQELTASRQAEEKQKARYHALFEFAPDGYLVTGIEGAIREANTAAASLLRAPKETLPGRVLSEFVRAADRDAFRERIRALHRGTIRRIDDWEIELEPLNGPRIPAVLTVATEGGNAATAGLRWIIRDDTQRQKLETEKASMLVGDARAEAARRFEFLAEASALLVGSLDVENSLTQIARRTASFLGGWCFVNTAYPNGAMRQLSVAHAEPSAADLADALRQHCLHGYAESQPPGDLPLEPQIVEPVTNAWYDHVADSPEHAVLLRRLHSNTAMVFPLRVHGRLLGILTVLSRSDRGAWLPADSALCEDLARRCTAALENARLYREVVDGRDKAERANGFKDEFVAMLGHELRHPLTPLTRWTAILENHPTVAAEPLLSEAVKAVGRNAAALARLIGECLDLTSISAGKLHLDRELVDLNRVVREAIEMVNATALSQGLEIHAEFAPGSATVLGDPLRLQQVVSNVLSNAVKYTERGGSITVRTIRTTDEVGVAVSDTGLGIEAGQLESVFEPFRQASNSWLTAPAGLGLGLTIARQIVQLHGGEIWAESLGPGHGSTFRVRLPRAAGVEKSAETAFSLKILLVEDSSDVQYVLKAELERSGYVVVTANNGKEGIAAAQAHRPDVIVSDVKMPVMDGFSMIRAIRAEAGLRDTPAIALTGLMTQAQVDRAAAAGFQLCVGKPGKLGELAAAIRKLVPDHGLIAKSADETL